MIFPIFNINVNSTLFRSNHFQRSYRIKKMLLFFAKEIRLNNGIYEYTLIERDLCFFVTVGDCSRFD